MAANPTAVWRVRPSGNDNNGGGYDAGIASAGTDYSQQNAAQVTQSGGTVSTATVTLTDTGAAFTSALIGNGIRVSGTGITTTYTYITAVPTGTTLTLQTSPGTTGTSVTYSIGGGWATIHTNTTSTGPLVAGNTCYILGTGTPSPSSYGAPDYTLSAVWAPKTGTLGGSSDGFITFANDPNTPGYKAFPDTTGGMPLIMMTGATASIEPAMNQLIGLWIFADSAYSNVRMIDFSAIGGPAVIKGCVLDQNAKDLYCLFMYETTVLGCEVFSSAGGSGTSSGIYVFGGANLPNYILSCNVHDCVGNGVELASTGTICILQNSIIAKCGGDGIKDAATAATSNFRVVSGCTIDGNTGHGINVTSSDGIAKNKQILNNIISNHTTGGKSGITVPGTTAQNDRNKFFVDFNVYYNNATDLTGISYGPHDTHGGSNPYVSQSTENYALA